MCSRVPIAFQRKNAPNSAGSRGQNRSPDSEIHRSRRRCHHRRGDPPASPDSWVSLSATRSPKGRLTEPRHALPHEKFYVPGSVLRVSVDNTNPLAYGFTGTADVFFDSDPVYKLSPDASMKGISPVAWFSGAEPLRSGWAWGQQYLDGGITIAEAKVGEGKLFLLGPKVTFRAQPHGTFKFLFNGIYYGTSKPAQLGPAQLGR